MNLDFGGFAGNRGTTFRFRPQGSPADVPLELVEIRGLGSAPEGEPASFSLHFRGPAGPLLPQGTYAVQHDAMGSFAIFVVPIGRDASGVSYEAIFNRG